MEPKAYDRAALLRAYLEHMDEPCPACGYSLRGLREEQCPECGEALYLRVTAAQPRMVTFLAGLLGLAFGAGFFVVSLALLAVWSAADDGMSTREFLPFIAGACACGAPLWLWIALRQRLREAPKGAVTGAVILCWAWPGVVVIVSVMLMLK
jgi:hypothetical protein